ncbi:MAG: hypothetical protein R3E42_06755 [Burkholderiaceae bacterium]
MCAGEGTDEAIDIRLSLEGDAVNVDFPHRQRRRSRGLQSNAGDALSDLMQRGGVQLGGVSVGSRSATGRSAGQPQRRTHPRGAANVSQRHLGQRNPHAGRRAAAPQSDPPQRRRPVPGPVRLNLARGGTPLAVAPKPSGIEAPGAPARGCPNTELRPVQTGKGGIYRSFLR